MSKPIINLPGKRKCKTLLSDLEPGEVFMYEGGLYMKTQKVVCYDIQSDYQVLSLKSGVFMESREINDWSVVIPVKVTIDVEYE